jgi:hypothetical protein
MPSDQSLLVREFATQLTGYVGRRVRVPLSNHETREGILIGEPQVFKSIDTGGGIADRGLFVLTQRNGQPNFVGSLDQGVTYDVLPNGH